MVGMMSTFNGTYLLTVHINGIVHRKMSWFLCNYKVFAKFIRNFCMKNRLKFKLLLKPGDTQVL